MKNLNNPWYKEWFNTPFYHDLYGNRDFNEAEKFIETLLSHISISKQGNCIDLGCGKGRHTHTLAKSGYTTLGLDLSEQSIETAKETLNVGASFLVHDMRKPFPLKNANAVFNLFTSFGYFEDFNTDLTIIKNVFASLCSGGVFIQDYINGYPITKALPLKQSITKELATYHILKYLLKDTIYKEIVFEFENENQTFTEKVQVFTLDKLKQLHEMAGFTVKQVYGNYALDEYNPLVSPRIILISYKP